ncbi:MAG: YdcF family protein [Candidatus Rokubacteria bacterium]|nr:YdcF family protein [Candidatus Rokubacteria bacterium]
MPRLRAVLALCVRWGLAPIGAVMLVITQTPLPDWAIRTLATDAPLEKADAIVVLGAGVRFDGSVQGRTLERLVYALRLFREGYAPVVIMTGGNPDIPELSESGQMARVALELGFSPEKFIVETEAKRTSEQARAIAGIVRAREMKSVILVTSPAHSYRALLAFQKAGVQALPGTTDPVLKAPSPQPGWQWWFALTPGKAIYRLNLAGVVFYEYVALGLYWWKGWI